MNSVAVMMFLTNLEVPVVTTALVAITNDLGSFDNAAWVVASYLLGYVGKSLRHKIITYQLLTEGRSRHRHIRQI